jgi:hypothetical protein
MFLVWNLLFLSFADSGNKESINFHFSKIRFPSRVPNPHVTCSPNPNLDANSPNTQPQPYPNFVKCSRFCQERSLTMVSAEFEKAAEQVRSRVRVDADGAGK